MPKLNQIVAVVNGKKTETKKELTALHRACGTSDLFAGLSRSYQPLDEEGEKFPDETKEVRMRSQDALDKVSKLLTDMFDVVLTQDIANCSASADIEVDDFTIAPKVPVTYLMFLEKQLLDVETFVNGIPTLDLVNKWEFDPNQQLYVSDESNSNKTKKVIQHKVLYEATKEHPAQIEKWSEDVTVGNWSTRKFSGAMSQSDKSDILVRVKKLKEAVKFAREEANSIEVAQLNIGERIFKYLFAQ